MEVLKTKLLEAAEARLANRPDALAELRWQLSMGAIPYAQLMALQVACDNLGAIGPIPGQADQVICGFIDRWLERLPKRQRTLPDPLPPEPRPALPLQLEPAPRNCKQSMLAAIPGKQPNTANGKLAVMAAWQIECETGRVANAKAVIARLQAWADEGIKPDTLIRSDKAKRGVWWNTGKGEKLYDLEACTKCLDAWMKSRA